MKSISFEKLTNPEFLRTMTPCVLLDFLKDHEPYFADNQVKLAEFKLGNDKAGNDEYKRLARLLRIHGANAPQELFDRLFLIQNAADAVHADKLLEIIGKSGYKSCLDGFDNPTPADLAVLIARHSKRDLERLCIEEDVGKRKSYVYFRAAPGKPRTPCRKVDKMFLDGLTASFNECFSQQRIGKKSAEIIHDDLENGDIQFVVRKSCPLARQEGIEESGKAQTNIFRPAIYDLVLFRPKKRELRVSMPRKALWALELYRRKFGEYLYGDEEYFSDTNLITLRPIGKLREKVLEHEDVVDESGNKLLGGVRMVSCVIAYDNVPADSNGEEDFSAHFKGKEVFAFLANKGIEYSEHTDFRTATFKLKPRYSEKEHPVTISNGNKASYQINNDSEVIERWLVRRGFVTGVEDEEPDMPRPAESKGGEGGHAIAGE